MILGTIHGIADGITHGTILGITLGITLGTTGTTTITAVVLAQDITTDMMAVDATTEREIIMIKVIVILLMGPPAEDHIIVAGVHPYNKLEGHLYLLTDLREVYIGEDNPEL